MKKWQKTGLLIVWCIIIAGCFYFRKELTTEQILNHTPGNLLAAFFMMMGLFAVKSVSVVIYSGLLFAVKRNDLSNEICHCREFLRCCHHGYTSLAHREKRWRYDGQFDYEEVSEDGEVKRDLYRKWVHTDISSPGDRKNTE